MELAPELETRFKEVLYRCLEEIQATKAALYLFGEDGSYRLATQYGFKKGLKKKWASTDEIVDRLLVRRTPYAINGLAEDSLFSEMLYEADTSKILVAPVYSRGKLAGFLDIRDRAGGRNFGSEDFKKASAICDEFLDVFVDAGMYGQRKIALGDAPTPQGIQQARSAPPSPAIIDRAEAEINRGALLGGPSVTSRLDDKFAAAASVLPAFLGLRSIAVAAVSAFSDTGGLQQIVAKGDVPEESLAQFDNRLRIWLQRRGEELPLLRSSVEYPFGTREYRVTPERIKNLLGAPVRAAEPQTMILSVVFDQKPDEDTRGQLETLHKMLEDVVENASGSAMLDALRENVAMRLLEPDLEAYPDLILHSRRVAELSADLGRKIGMSDLEVEDVRLTGLVHDVGLRAIGYQRVQRKGKLSEEEMQIIRKHPVVGAAIVAGSALGADIARYVYSHHERIDGTGYPDGIPGNRIPVPSRIVHLCEAYEVMTSDHSYKAPVGRPEALRRIRVEAGTQFDPDLAGAFCSMIENS